MKKTLLIALGVGMFSLPVAQESAANTVTTNRSGEGVKVINNFNYGAAPIRPVVQAQPVYVAQPQPVLVAQPVPMYTQTPPPHTVQVAVSNDEVRPAVLKRAEPEPEREWYVALKYVHTLASWKTSNHWVGESWDNGVDPVVPVNESWTDKYSMKSMMGFAASVGMTYDNDWRLEVEGGYTGQYSEAADGIKYAVSAPYLSLNALYNFNGNKRSGFYIGPGLGIAFPQTELTSYDNNTLMPGAIWFLHGGETARSFSVMPAGMFGFQWMLEERLALDIGYKFYALKGPKHKRQFYWWDNTDPSTAVAQDLTIDTGWMTNHAISLGLRYYF